MAAPTYSDFDIDDVQLSQFARAIGHPARVAILKVLAEREECICGEIVEVVPLAQSTVSQHLRELKKAGLIQGRIFGPKSCYCINWEVLNQFRSAFAAFSGLMDTAEKAAEPC